MRFLVSKDISLQDSLRYYNRKYGELASNAIHIQKSLVYFQDAYAPHVNKSRMGGGRG